ncbi:MAG: flagellar motor switch protein FliM [Fimbriimonadaceae bacterium]|nr:flagellar motor switch protein FliM [Fimbriimonadaceae bacterium]
MSDILSQAEIEALLQSLSQDGDQEEPVASAGTVPDIAKTEAAMPGPVGHTTRGRKAQRHTVAYEVYDFRRPDKFSKDQLRTLQMLHETFARHATSGLSAYLRSPVSIELVALEQVPFEEYLRSLNKSVFTKLSLLPLNGSAVLEIEFGLIFAIVDRLLGGPGRPISRNVLTDIERPLIQQTLDRMLAALQTAWEGVVVVKPSIESIETSSQFVQIAPPNDIVVSILFEIKIGNQRGAMSLCIPYLILKPITAKLSAQKWFASSNRRLNNQVRRQLSAQIARTTVDCKVRLGNRKISFRDFLRLKAGDTLLLDQRVEEDLTLMVGDIPKFSGQAAKSGNRIVFSISRPIPQE